ncbi:phosphonate C-P lyase system protein PhnG [Martelella endophytica]|nr:phosphonate C-P lyase system protein PhnG [Martelella endophytica]
MSPEQAARAEAAGLLARAKTDELKDALAALAAEESVTALKGPETGLVMLRGRIGGGGAAFNLGEATMSRASVRLSDGLVGHGQCLGTDRDKAQLIAILDALFQRPGLAGPIETQLLTPVRKRVAAEAETRAEETAATRVDFFTMVRGDN